MIYIIHFIIAFLIISFIIFFIIYIYCKIVKKETGAYWGMLISLVLLLPIDKIGKHLIKNELIKNIKTSEINQNKSSFSKKELSEIHIVSEKMRVTDQDIFVILMPQKDTLYLNQDFHIQNKFWIHYKKYEILKITAPIGYIIKN